MALAAASRYARALADLAFDPAHNLDPERVADELALLDEALAASVELRNALLSPAVAPARKRRVISRLADQGGVSRLVRNFLSVVIDRRRIALLPEIRQAFRGLLDERMGMVEAGVTTARGLDEAERHRVAGRLERVTGKKVRCRFEVDETLIGGIQARIGSTIYDGSVRGQLSVLRQRLTG